MAGSPRRRLVALVLQQSLGRPRAWIGGTAPSGPVGREPPFDGTVGRKAPKSEELEALSHRFFSKLFKMDQERLRYCCIGWAPAVVWFYGNRHLSCSRSRLGWLWSFRPRSGNVPHPRWRRVCQPGGQALHFQGLLGRLHAAAVEKLSLGVCLRA